MIPSIVEARVRHIPSIAAHVRPADEAELWAAAFVTPTHAMLRSLNLSLWARTGLVDEEPVCMFGVVRVSCIGNVGRPWMVGTELLDRYAGVFLRRCRREVKRMLDDFDLLENYIDSRNVRAITWLKWLGFEMGDPEPFGPLGIPFIKFRMEKRHAQ